MNNNSESPLTVSAMEKIQKLKKHPNIKEDDTDQAIRQFLERGGEINILPPETVKKPRNYKSISPGDTCNF